MKQIEEELPNLLKSHNLMLAYFSENENEKLYHAITQLKRLDRKDVKNGKLCYDRIRGKIQDRKAIVTFIRDIDKIKTQNSHIESNMKQDELDSYRQSIKYIKSIEVDDINYNAMREILKAKANIDAYQKHSALPRYLNYKDIIHNDYRSRVSSIENQLNFYNICYLK